MQYGFSLLEVLITLAMISIGMFALTDAELQALRYTQSTAISFALNQQLETLAEECQASLHPSVVLAQWQSQLKTAWPAVQITLTPDQQYFLIVQLQWQKNNENYQLQQKIYFPNRI